MLGKGFLTAWQLSHRLGEFKVASGTVRVGHRTGKGYTLEQFGDAFARYLFSPDPPAENVTTSQPSNGAGFSGFSSVTSSEFSADVTEEKGLKARQGAGCDVVTDTDPLLQKKNVGDGGEVVL